MLRLVITNSPCQHAPWAKTALLAACVLALSASTLLPGFCTSPELAHLAAQPWAAGYQASVSPLPAAGGRVGLWLHVLLGYLFSIKAYHLVLLLTLCSLSCLKPELFEAARPRQAAMLAATAAFMLQKPERLGWLGLSGFSDLIIGPHVAYTLLAFAICWFGCLALQGSLLGRQVLPAYFFLWFSNWGLWLGLLSLLFGGLWSFYNDFSYLFWSWDYIEIFFLDIFVLPLCALHVRFFTMQGLALATALETYLSIIQFFRLSILGSPHHLTSPSQPLPCSCSTTANRYSWQDTRLPAHGLAAPLFALACLSLVSPPPPVHLHGLGARGAPGVLLARQGRAGWGTLLIILYYMGFAAFAMAQPQTPVTLIIKLCAVSMLSWLPTSTVAAQLSIVTLPACLALVSCLLRLRRGFGLHVLKAAALTGVVLLHSSLLAAPALGLAVTLRKLLAGLAAVLSGLDAVTPEIAPCCRAAVLALSGCTWGLSTCVFSYLDVCNVTLRSMRPARGPLYPLKNLNFFASHHSGVGAAAVMAICGDSLALGAWASWGIAGWLKRSLWLVFEDLEDWVGPERAMAAEVACRLVTSRCAPNWRATCQFSLECQPSRACAGHDYDLEIAAVAAGAYGFAAFQAWAHGELWLCYQAARFGKENRKRAKAGRPLKPETLWVGARLHAASARFTLRQAQWERYYYYSFSGTGPGAAWHRCSACFRPLGLQLWRFYAKRLASTALGSSCFELLLGLRRRAYLSQPKWLAATLHLTLLTLLAVFVLFLTPVGLGTFGRGGPNGFHEQGLLLNSHAGIAELSAALPGAGSAQAGTGWLALDSGGALLSAAHPAIVVAPLMAMSMRQAGRVRRRACRPGKLAGRAYQH